MESFKITTFWHIIDGKFVIIRQEEIQDTVVYYTNGIREGSAKWTTDGFIDEHSVVLNN